MSQVGQPERATQNRVVSLFRDELGYRPGQIDRALDFKLDKYLLKICAKERLLELMHDFVLFDGILPKWPVYRDRLNRLPVRHESWSY